MLDSDAAAADGLFRSFSDDVIAAAKPEHTSQPKKVSYRKQGRGHGVDWRGRVHPTFARGFSLD